MAFLTGGIDEVGTGALAGVFLSAVAVFRPVDLALLPAGVNDSKQVTERNREALYLPIVNTAYDVGIGHAWPWEVDDLGPVDALQLSYTRALGELRHKPDLLYVDGNFPVRSWKGKQQVEPKADARYREVSAASIIAKVLRDGMMRDLHKLYPKYLWMQNKGYGSDAHRKAIQQFGLVLKEKTPTTYIHRRRYCLGVV